MFKKLILQAAEPDTYAEIISLLVTIFKSLGTIGDSVSKLIQILFEAAGLSVPLIIWRVMMIFISAMIFWKFIGSMGFTLKLILGIVIMGAVFGIFGASFFEEGLLKLPSS